jgi:hypothetical protein
VLCAGSGQPLDLPTLRRCRLRFPQPQHLLLNLLENRGVKFQGSWGLTVATLLALGNNCQRVCDQLAPQVSFAPGSGHYSTHGAKPTRGCLQRLSHSAIGLGIFLDGIGPFLANTAVAIEKK